MKMSAEEQEMDRARLKSYIAREQLSGVLNDTKWQELFSALEPIREKLDFLRKDVRDPESNEPRWDSDFYHVFGRWENIEWICIRAKLSIPQGALLEPNIEDYTNELITVLKRVGVPFSKITEGVKVWGYLRPRVSPDWAQ